jgi:DNA-binding Lrp family transcriptional regulator
MTLDDADRRILDEVQRDFPLESRPFAALAERIGSTEGEVLDRIRRLTRDGIIREVGPVFDLKRLGHTSTLCAAQAAPDCIENVAGFINAFPEVTHNYLRDHAFNIWFTLIAASPDRIDAILERIRIVPGVLNVMSLPAQRTFKIDVFFRTSKGGTADNEPREHRPSEEPPTEQLTSEDKRLVRVLSEAMPLTERPFAEIARQAGVSEAAVIERVRAWISSGVIRRFGARVDHRAVGYGANGMSVWKVPADRAETAGSLMARQPEVSHCYLRLPRPEWEYNLYAMIHGQTEDEVRAVAEHMAEETGLRDYAVLFSSREFKKSAPRYFCE